MEYNRVKWASRRGMLELDLLLMPFVENVYPNLTDAEQQEYHELLDCEDQDLFAWFLDSRPCERDDLKSIVKRVVSSARPSQG